MSSTLREPTPVPGFLLPAESKQPGEAANQGQPGTVFPAGVSGSRNKQKRTGIVVGLVLLVVVLGGLGTVFSVWGRRPNPVLLATSSYHQGTTIVAASTTTLHITGRDFSANTSLIMLLDNAPAPGLHALRSDENGALHATITVPAAWPLGRHVLKARDANGYETQAGQVLFIVSPGQAHTPGPHGAPPDDAHLLITGTIREGGTRTVVLIVADARVCAPLDDDQPHTTTGPDYTETSVLTCSGTYRSGMVTYRETAVSDILTFSNGAVCSAAP